MHKICWLAEEIVASPEEIWWMDMAQEMGCKNYSGFMWALVTAVQNLWFYSETDIFIKVKNADPKRKNCIIELS